MGDKIYVRGNLHKGQKGLFSKGTDFYGFEGKQSSWSRIKSTNYTGRVNAPYREMMIGRGMKSGPLAKNSWEIKHFNDARYMELPKDYSGTGKHNTKNGMFTKKMWSVPGFDGNRVIVLKDFKQMHLQMVIAAHQLPIAAEHYRFVLAQRALKIFQNSFTVKRFYSLGTTRWTANARSTVRKRKRMGYWPATNKLLQMTNYMYKSLEYVPDMAPFTSGVKATADYSGFHNDPRPGDTYGRSSKRIIRRQFMGHSTSLDEFIASYEKSYLFDTVFRQPT